MKDVQVPVSGLAYDPAALTPGVVHIGVGDFHRAHQAGYFHDLAQRGVRDWGIIGVSLRSGDLKDVLDRQELRYTIVERGPEQDVAHVVAPMLRYLHGPDEPEAVLEALTDPRIRLVTLTVTHHGYCVDPVSGCFEADCGPVAADVASPGRPRTFFGYVTEALARRRRAGTAPFTVLSCDNVPHAGATTRTAVVSYARMIDPELAAWIDREVAFPSSMVDRITPRCSAEVARVVREDLGLDDAAPVATEPFRQWIIEDVFCNDRPPLDEVGAVFVADTAPHELLKQRMLNGTHSALAYIGYLMGHRTADAAVSDVHVRAYLDRLLEHEVIPLLPEVDSVPLRPYKDALLQRIANPKIADDLERLCRRGSTKVPAFVVASLREARAAGRPHDVLLLAVASWIRYLRGVDFNGDPIEIDDPHAEQLRRLMAGGDPGRLLARRSLFGELADDPTFVADMRAALALLDRRGPRGAIMRTLDRSAPRRLHAPLLNAGVSPAARARRAGRAPSHRRPRAH